MKNIKNQLMMAAAGLVAAVALAQPQAARAGGAISWQFPNSNTVVNCTGSPGGAIAIINFTPPMATGWTSQDPTLLGSAQGVWDLGGPGPKNQGKYGTITLTNLSGVVGGPGQARTITVSVVQLFSGMYDVLASVSIPGATCVSNTQSVAANPTGSSTGLTSEWVVNVTQWTVPAGTSVNTAVITSATDGSLVNSVSLAATAVVVAAPTPQLTIKSLGSQQVQISCAANTNMELQSTANLSNPNSWANVMQVTNGTVVTLKATNAMQFYRLK